MGFCSKKKLNVNNKVGKIIISIFQRIKPNVRLDFFFLKMFQSSTHSIKNAGRYFEQFVKVSLPKNGGTNQVKKPTRQSLHITQIQIQFLQQQWKWQL